MKKKVFTIVLVMIVLAFPTVNAFADESDHDQGVVRFDQTIGHIVMWTQDGGCSMKFTHAEYDNNDFKILNADGMWFSKIQEDAILEYYDLVSENWYYGAGHVTYNWHYGDNVSYGVLLAKGYVYVDAELKDLVCKLIVDGSGEPRIYSIILQ